ncbi:hypothetical protein P3G55_01965 [Leptospira sp. 96542]|nr:hypothetical protein [Leptospira sp. 96542]
MLPLKLRTILLTAIFLCFGLEITPQTESHSIPKNEFGMDEGLLPEDTATYPELKNWAIFQSYELVPDSPFMGIQDFICRMVPDTGLRFLLEKPVTKKSTVYLYLDLTQYKPLPGSRFKPKKITISVNGIPKLSIYTDRSRSFKNPVEIPLEPSEYPEGKILVELTPSQNTTGRFWGIWDAVVLENKRSEGDSGH